MNPTPDGIVSSLLHGDYQTVVKAMLLFALLHYGAFMVTYLKQKWVELWELGRTKLHEITPAALQQIEDRFFDLMEKAVSNQIHLDDNIANLAASGSLDGDTLRKFGSSVLEDMKAATGVADLTSFAMALFGNTKEINADGTPSPVLSRAIKAKLDANLARVAGEVGSRVGERRLARQLKQRELTVPVQPK